MKILMVSWEYPPVVVGGLGRHVHHLATELVQCGHEVVVLSRRPTGTDAATHPTSHHIEDGVLVVAVAEDPAHFVFGEDMLAWTLAMGHAMVRAGVALGNPAQQPGRARAGLQRGAGAAGHGAGRLDHRGRDAPAAGAQR